MYKAYYGGLVLMDPSQDIRIYNAKVNVAVNTAGTFTFTMAPDHPLYSQMEVRNNKHVRVKWESAYSDDTVFYGNVVDVIKNSDLSLTVTAKDPIYELSGIKYRPMSYKESETSLETKTFITRVMSHFNEVNLSSYLFYFTSPYEAGRQDYRNSTRWIVNVEPNQVKTAFDHISSTVLVKSNSYVTYKDDGFYFATQPLQTRDWVIRLGENVKDIKVEVNEQDFPTAVYALGGEKYPTYVGPTSGAYGDTTTHFRLAANKSANTWNISLTFDRSISNYKYENMFIYSGGSPSGTNLYSFLQIDYYPDSSHTAQHYVGYGRVYLNQGDSTGDGYKTVADGETVNVYLPGLLGTELKTSDNIDIMMFSARSQDGESFMKGPCMLRDAGAAGPNRTSSANPVETTYDGKQMLVDYSTLIIKDLARKYGVKAIEYVDDTIRVPDILFERAYNELTRNIAGSVRVSVDAIDPAIAGSNDSHVQIGDSVLVESTAHGLSGRMMLSGMELDLNNPANNRYTFGNQATTVTDRIAALNARISGK